MEQLTDFVLYYIPEYQAITNKLQWEALLWCGIVVFLMFVCAVTLNKCNSPISAIILTVITAGIMMGGGVWFHYRAHSLQNESYLECLYKHYDKYQPYISDVINTSKSEDDIQYTLIISKEYENTKITLNDSSTEFIERIDEQSPGIYYELHRDEQTQKLVLIKYIGTKEQAETENKHQIKKIYEK